MLAIASGELGPGKRLPSTRALAKRYRLNANTVSAAYRQLERAGWVGSVHGSGVYVRAKQHDPAAGTDALDQLVLPFLRAAQTAGLSANAIRNRIDYWLATRPKRFVFVHPEAELRAIIARELRQALSWPVEACAAEPAGMAAYAGDSIFVTVPSKHAAVRRLLPATSEVVTLQIRRVDQALAQYLPIHPEVLLAIASAWPGFLRIARTVLTAAGCDPDAMLFRDARDDRWKQNLGPVSAIVCDALTADSIPDGVHKIVFTLVSDAGLARLRSFERFFAG
jgi:DNA-binding transcriptional regulator YhcF (GntR family)